MAELILIKWGGSLITDKHRPLTARHTLIQRLAHELAQAHQARPDLHIILGHGSGSFGHATAAQYGTRRGVHSPEAWFGFAHVAHIAARLNRIVVEALLDAGIPAISIQPSALITARDGELLHFPLHPVENALAAGLLPVLYGDVAFDETWGGTIISTEQLLIHLAHRLPTSTRLLILGEVDGVYDRDPHHHPDARPIPTITPTDLPNLASSLGGSHGTDVTGGMRDKVQRLTSLVEQRPEIDIRIFSGLTPNALFTALTDPHALLGTRIHNPAGRR